MANKADLIAYNAAAADGFNGVEYDHTKHGMLTSGMHACYCLGLHLRETGREIPGFVRPSRGDLVRAGDMLFRANWVNVKHPVFTRE